MTARGSCWGNLVGVILCGIVSFTACDLDETIVSEGESIVVVHAVLRPDLPENFFRRQYVIVERSLTGLINPDTAEESEDGRFHRADSLTIPYGGYPAVPIEGAIVQLANLDYPDDPCGASVQFVEYPGYPVHLPNPGIYWSPQDCPTLRAGDRIALTVETPSGDTIYGETRIPAMESAYLKVAGDSLSFGEDVRVDFNRDRDTLRITIDAEAGRLLQFEVRRDGDLTDFGTKIYVDTTSFALPANVINTFVIGDEDDVFRAGRDYVLSVALTDTNYFDFSRSRINSFTGRGFINRLSGGIGVFGSLVSLSTPGRAFGDQEDPREGRYTLVGTYGDRTSVELTMDIYLGSLADTAEFSAFATGQGFFGDVDKSIDGAFVGNNFSAVLISDIGMGARADTLRGIRREGEPWQVIAYSLCRQDDEQEDFIDCSERTIIFRGTMTQH